MRHRIPRPATVVPSLRDQAIDDLREEAIRPVRMSPITRSIEFLHRSPYSTAILNDGHLIPRDSLVWDINDVFRIVQESHGIVIAPSNTILPSSIKNRS
jgi:hypothetical protein